MKFFNVHVRFTSLSLKFLTKDDLISKHIFIYLLNMYWYEKLEKQIVFNIKEEIKVIHNSQFFLFI